MSEKVSWLGLERGERQRMRALRRQFVAEELPQFEVDNEELRVGFTRRQMMRVLWIKSARLLHMQQVAAPGEESPIELVS